jgi:phenylalanyl-tRNA synthetase beta chain
MQIPVPWINELVNIATVNVDYLVEKLTLSGFEVEEILEIEIDNQKTLALDISATANRSDSLSVQGISLEIGALLNKPPKISKYLTRTFEWEDRLQQCATPNLSHSPCSSFMSLAIHNLENFTSPKWLKQKLVSSGLVPENNLNDFQNYLILEMGYPFEFYDLNKIKSKVQSEDFTISLEYGTQDQRFTATNEIEYSLNDSVVIVKANDVPLSIGGIIANAELKPSEATTSLLIEASIFTAAKIRQQSRVLGLRTDRSSRYEKSLKNANLLEACYRLVSLLRISNPNLVCDLHTNSNNRETDGNVITLSYTNINKVLGPIRGVKSRNYISIENIHNYLNRLNFESSYNKEECLWTVRVPYLRSDDIVQEIDLIEEIGRIHGFNNFLTQLPVIRTVGTEDFSYQTRKKLNACFTNLGLNEFIHYSLVPDYTYTKNEIKLVNPLLKDCSNLRSTLLPSVIGTIQDNVKNGNSTVEGFEYGHVFSVGNDSQILEQEHVAGILGGLKTKSNWSDSPTNMDWFEAKGKIEELFQKLNFLIYWKPCQGVTQNEFLHPYCTADIVLSNGERLGVFGQIHPFLAKKLNISPHLYLFEFDFTQIKNQLKDNKFKNYQEYSLYPKIIKDLSFIIDKNISFHQLKETLYLNGSKYLTEVTLLDEYRGKSIPGNCTSLCLQLSFQSHETTLQTLQVETIMNHLQSLLISKFQAEIRT